MPRAYRERREPNELEDIEFDVGTDCKNKDKVPFNPGFVEFYKNGGGAINHPYHPADSYNRAAVASAAGKDSWKWLLLGPASN